MAASTAWPGLPSLWWPRRPPQQLPVVWLAGDRQVAGRWLEDSQQVASRWPAGGQPHQRRDDSSGGRPRRATVSLVASGRDRDHLPPAVTPHAAICGLVHVGFFGLFSWSGCPRILLFWLGLTAWPPVGPTLAWLDRPAISWSCYWLGLTARPSTVHLQSQYTSLEEWRAAVSCLECSRSCLESSRELPGEQP